MATVDDKKIIFSMVGVSKTIHQTNKQVLKNIYLSFFYGAKIGIIGLNGSGKSTLMKIIAGLDKDFQGEVVFSPGYSVGYLPQEPQLDPSKTVKEVVMEGVQPIVDALTEYEEINQKFGLPEYYEDEDKMNALFARQGDCRTSSMLRMPGIWTANWNVPWMLCAVHRPTSRWKTFREENADAWHFAASCCRNRTCCCSTSRPTIWMPKASTGWSSI